MEISLIIIAEGQKPLEKLMLTKKSAPPACVLCRGTVLGYRQLISHSAPRRPDVKRGPAWSRLNSAMMSIHLKTIKIHFAQGKNFKDDDEPFIKQVLSPSTWTCWAACTGLGWKEPLPGAQALQRLRAAPP